MATQMTQRELDRLSALLMKWHETHPGDGEMRDEVSALRFCIEVEMEERFPDAVYPRTEHGHA